jgi:hypothetical protein
VTLRVEILVFTLLVNILTFLEVNTLVIIKENINDYELRNKSFIESLIESLIPLKSLIRIELRNESLTESSIPPKSLIHTKSRDKSPVELPIKSPVNYTIDSTTEQLEVKPF